MKKLILPIALIGLLSACSSIDLVDERYKEIAKKHDLPANPGEDVNLTLQGIDSNKNGVRDDIEREIYLLIDVVGVEDNYPELRDMLLDQARELGFILVVNNKEEQYKRAKVTLNSLKSYVIRQNKDLESKGIAIDPNRIDLVTDESLIKMVTMIEKMTFNTKDRMIQYYQLKKSIRHSGLLLV